uniref:ubiquitinyl hydrolase 1 n=1 Tax=Angiostrongylus cantonensis TaxID=6313 RepID=A0A0K0D1Q0_ANGCA
MKCAAEIYKDSNIPPMDVEIQRALMPLERGNAQSSSTPSTKVVNKKDSTHDRQAAQTRGRSIGSFAVINRPLAKDVDDDFDLDFPKGLTGLYNLGNTCYFNASIQVLSNCPPFSDYFRDKVRLYFMRCILPLTEDLRPYATREPLVAHTMAQLIQKLWSDKREPAVFPKVLLARVRDSYPQFRGWIQQDAQELIRCLLELLHSELAQPVYDYEDYSVLTPRDLERQNSTSSNGSDHLGLRLQIVGGVPMAIQRVLQQVLVQVLPLFLESVSFSIMSKYIYTSAIMLEFFFPAAKVFSFPLRWRSIVTDVFDGSIESCVTCLTCRNVSITTETFQVFDHAT